MKFLPAVSRAFPVKLSPVDRGLALCGLLLLLVSPGHSADPAWWQARGALDGGAPAPNAVVNQGQLKGFTSKAVAELNADLAGGAGDALNNLVAGWQQDYANHAYATDPNNPTRPYKPADFQAVTVGQLKYVASLIWGRLQDGGSSEAYPPWIVANADTDNALANLGQLKTVFNFDLTPFSLQGPSTVYFGPPPSGSTVSPPYQYSAVGGTGGGYTYSVIGVGGIATINQQSGVLTPNFNGTVCVYAQDSAGNLAVMTVTITSVFVDNDGNQIDDNWEKHYFGATGVSPTALAPGGSGLTNLQEYQLNLNPNVLSTVNDGMSDGWKIQYGLDAHDINLASEIVPGSTLTYASVYAKKYDPTRPSDFPDTGSTTIPVNVYAKGAYPIDNPSPIDPTTAVINWSGVSPGFYFKVDGYQVERKIDHQSWATIATVHNSEQVSDPGLVANHIYTYRVTAMQQGHLLGNTGSATYEVPFTLKLAYRKSPAHGEKGDWSFPEYTDAQHPASNPPVFYLLQKKTSSIDEYNYHNTYSDGSLEISIEKHYRFTSSEPMTPSTHSNEYNTTYSFTETDVSYARDGSVTSTYNDSKNQGVNWKNQRRHKGQLSGVATVILNDLYGSGNYSLTGVFTPAKDSQGKDIPPRWNGFDYDLAGGSVVYSGTSFYEDHSYPNDTTSSNTTVDAGGNVWSGTFSETKNGTTTTTAVSGGPPCYVDYPKFDHFTPLGPWTAAGNPQFSHVKRSGEDNDGTTDTKVEYDLSSPYDTKTFVADVLNDAPDYPNSYSPYSDLYYDYNGLYDVRRSSSITRTLSPNEATFDATKFQYKLQSNPSAPVTLRWYEMFSAASDPSKLQALKERTWTLGSALESDAFEIDLTKATENGTAWLLFPNIDVESISRDEPLTSWGDYTAQSTRHAPLYSSIWGSGDMVVFSIPDNESWSDSTTYAWTAEGPATISGPSGPGMDEWRIEDKSGNDPNGKHDLDWPAGQYTIKCVITFPGGGTATVTHDQDIGMRSKDVVVIGWINKKQVPLSTRGVSRALTIAFPQNGELNFAQVPLAIGFLGDLATNFFQAGPLPWSDADKTYVLNWMFKYSANFHPPHPDGPPTKFADEDELSEFVELPTNYKLYNRLQINYTCDSSGFGNTPVTRHAEAYIGVTIDPVFRSHVPGVAGPQNNNCMITIDQYALVNDGTPASAAVRAFDSLLYPLKWNDIGSQIDEGIQFDRNPTQAPSIGLQAYNVKNQVYPTYYIYERLNDGAYYLMKVVQQAKNPSDNFNVNPYPPGPAPYAFPN